MEEKKYLFSYRKHGDPTTFVEERTEAELDAQEQALFVQYAVQRFEEIYNGLPPSLRKRFLLRIKNVEND
jgi:hypothetical protein